MAEYEIRPDRLYTAGDTWVCPTEEGILRVGITDYAQRKLKTIEYLALPEAGDGVEQNGSLGEVESKKAVSQLISPLTGTVGEINGRAVDDPSLLNREPYEAWILTLECPDFAAQSAALMDARAYEAYLATRK